MSRPVLGRARDADGIHAARLRMEAEPYDTVACPWYACYTKARSEKKVDALLRRRGFESYLPLVPVVSRWSDRKKLIEWPLFPGYVFARSPSTALGEVMCTPGVAAIVRFGGRPVPIPDEEISNVARFARALATTDLRPSRVRLREGQRVRIISGPMEGVYGTVRECRGRARVLVGLSSIGVGFEVDVAIDSLKLAEA